MVAAATGCLFLGRGQSNVEFLKTVQSLVKDSSCVPLCVVAYDATLTTASKAKDWYEASSGGEDGEPPSEFEPRPWDEWMKQFDIDGKEGEVEQ